MHDAVGCTICYLAQLQHTWRMYLSSSHDSPTHSVPCSMIQDSTCHTTQAHAQLGCSVAAEEYCQRGLDWVPMMHLTWQLTGRPCKQHAA